MGARVPLLLSFLLVLPLASCAESANTPSDSVGDNELRALGSRIDFQLRPFPSDQWPYAVESPIGKDSEDLDESGVRVKVIDGVMFDHPVAQAQFGLANLASHHLTSEPFYLDRAIAQADRLIGSRIEFNGAWLFPYPFDFALHGVAEDTMHAPWISAMAQGQALSLFVGLSAATSDQKYANAAEMAFQSLNRLGETFGELPALTHIWNGHVWFEEYPAAEPESSDHTLNGHIYAIFGIADYYWATGSADAEALIRSGATTVLESLDGFRVEGGVSQYCLQHRVQSAKYHEIHVGQLASLAALTQDERFARWSRAFAHDTR